MITLGLGVITRNSDIKNLRKMLNSIKGFVDNIYITVADKERPTREMKLLAEEYNANLSFFEWKNDFSAARNFNMKLVKDDWFVWADTDDEVVGMARAKEFLSKLPKMTKFVICTYNYAFSETGEISVKHPKERFIRNDGLFTWKGKLHESCISDSQENGINWDGCVWNHKKSTKEHKESTLRNIKIIEKEIEEMIIKKDVDPRTVFNLGMAYASFAQLTNEQKDWDDVLRAFYKYIEVGGWDQHAYMAWKYIGFAHMKLNRADLALNAYFEALKLKPQFADAHAMIGTAYQSLNDHEKAEVWYKIALVAGDVNTYAHDIETSLLAPTMGLIHIYAMKGKYKEALAYVKAAKKYLGENDKYISDVEAELKSMKELIETGRKKLREIMRARNPQDAYAKLEEKYKMLPEVIQYRKSQNWKKESSGKELVIFTGKGWETWTPETAKTGIGGSEEAVIYLAKRLVKLGWDVTCYGNHGPETKVYDGVKYSPWWEWSPREPVDVLIVWRDPHIFDLDLNAKKKYLWLHDTNPESQLTDSRLANLDKVFVLSEYHRSLYPNKPDDKFVISANGLVPEQFKQDIQRNPHKCFYGSAPNRGLKILLQLWPKIREQVPDAELHWAYGWETFDKFNANNPVMKKYKEDILALLDQPGVVSLGRIGHEDIAKLMLSSGVWLYPTSFTEIYCITAIKAQAAGAIPVTTNVAALDEMVQFGTKLDCRIIEEDKDAQEEFVKKAVEAMKNKNFDREAMSEWALTTKTWDVVANQWDTEFKK